MTAPEPGTSPEDHARQEAAKADLRAVIAKRREVARTLLAPPEPAKAVKDAWGPITNRDRR